ncbi:carboxylesterase family protein [Telluria mixta]|uniref:Carboxylesterase family protein n=1 Tax=Telluria mixta TaxID=34071 RepID=A0ABT2C1U5_9BURK|nr:carboxylesterase family protein [Telluria mixta]MCS0631157.1 carboxylesterase family protein [Telluria mixta]WEM95695.1 carboxylesterase family protein [Telluria mixta]
MSSSRLTFGLALVLAAALPAAAMAQGAPDVGHVPELAIGLAKAPSANGLAVTSPAFAQGDGIPLANTQYGANRFPGLHWTAGPRGTASYAVIVQGDPRADGHAAATSIHLTAVNLPADATSLPAGMTTLPAGAAYGPNVHGLAQPYAGPHTHTAARQPYHFQVFALDTTLATDPSLTFDKAIAAMQGHVLASGDLVGMSGKPAEENYAKAVPTESGLVAGIPGRDPSVTVYKGIPYAAAPVGALRWRPPAPAPAWDGVRKADRFGHLCPQPAGPGASEEDMSEDCLTLNIWTGARPESRPRPVLVWIYPGGFIGGSGSDPLFDGEGLARKGIVVVTFNYRLGVFGFLATPELSSEAARESGHAASGNYGLLDDLAVLKWVQRNIAAFGGDPKRVTIAGQSAGAGSVGFLSISPLAKGLFQHAIAESHARDPRDPELRYLSVSYRLMKPAEEAGARFAEAKGTRDLAALRAMSWQRMVEGSNTVDGGIDTLSTAKPPLFRPVIDGWVLPRNYSATLAAHAQNKVVFIAGSNKDETGAVPDTAFAAIRARSGPPRAGAPQVNVTLDGFRQYAHAKFGRLAEQFLKLYPATNDEEAARASNEAARDNSRISTWSWARDWTKGSGRPVYTFFWTHAPPGPDAALRGAYHGAEINYALGNLYATDRPWTEDDRRIADTMSSYWANIVKTGNPNGAGLPDWPAYDARASSVMLLGDRFETAPIATPERIAFWQRFFSTQKPW